jgi:Uma2 family endonuclease
LLSRREFAPEARVSVPRTSLTADDLLKLPRGMGKRYELLDGELVEMAPAGFLHGIIAMRAGAKVSDFVAEHRLGQVVAAETGFFLRRHPDRVRAPDVAFIAADRLPRPFPSGYLDVIPDFVIEVISPTDTASDFQARIDEWLVAGVKVLWAIYPDIKTVFIWRGRDRVERREGEAELDAEPVLPGFRWKVNDLFQI